MHKLNNTVVLLGLTLLLLSTGASAQRVDSDLTPNLTSGSGPGQNAASLPSLSEATEHLRASDAIRNPPGSFSVKLELTEYRQKRQAAQSTLVVYARPAPQDGDYRNLVRFIAPAKDLGKLMLRNGQDLWFYDPASAASVRVSPQQRILGQASNGDVMTTQLALDYEVQSLTLESVRDGDGQTKPSHHLRLQAKHARVTYPQISYWIEIDTHRPVMARYYTAAHELLKTAWFRRFQPILGAVRPTETVIVDGLDPAWVTLMRLSEHTARDIPETWLQREHLPRFRDIP